MIYLLRAWFSILHTGVLRFILRRPNLIFLRHARQHRMVTPFITSTQRGVSVFVAACVGLIVCWDFASAQPTIQPLAPALARRALKAVRYLRDSTGSAAVAFTQEDINGMPQVHFMARRGGTWTSPLELPIANGNMRSLVGIETQTTGNQMMLLRGDETDYVRLFKLAAAPPRPANPGDPYIPGISDAAFESLLANNQKLLFSTQVGGRWQTPLPIRDTFKPLEAVLARGSGNGALAAFTRRPSAQSSAIEEVEVYVTVFDGSRWSSPARLTTNTTPDFGLQARYVQSGFLVTWVNDADGNLATTADRVIQFARITERGEAGSVGQLAAINTPNHSLPVLGLWQDTGVLVWETSVQDSEGVHQELASAFYGASWSIPVITGIRSSGLAFGALHERTDGLFLTYLAGGAFKGAYNHGVGWMDAGVLFDPAPTGVRIAEAAHGFDEYGHLSLILAGSQGVAGNVDEADDPDGLWYTQIPLVPDLAVSFVETVSPIQRIGAASRVRFTVTNLGPMPAGSYTATLANEAGVLETFSGQPLTRGQSQTFEHAVLLDRPEMPLSIGVSYGAQEVRIDNNTRGYTLKVLPDYSVRSVLRESPTTVVAHIDERKGTAAAPVAVDFYFQSSTQRIRIGSGTYDPNTAAPVAVDWPELATHAEPFQVSVVVNQSRTVREDSFANNLGAYNYNPLPDFTVPRLQITEDEITVTIRNEGTAPASTVDLLLTDSPQVASETAAGGTHPPLWMSPVTLDSNYEAQIVVPRSGLGQPTGQNLYAVVNPYGAIKETNRNNNLARTLFASANLNGGPGSIGKLRMKVGPARCGDVIVHVYNKGRLAVIGPTVEILIPDGVVAAYKTIPVIAKHKMEKLKFENVTPGNYTVRLSAVLPNGTPSSTQVPMTLRPPRGRECEPKPEHGHGREDGHDHGKDRDHGKGDDRNRGRDQDRDRDKNRDGRAVSSDHKDDRTSQGKDGNKGNDKADRGKGR